mmetsp:Transcript_19003/g.38754  ORF Transcript_19003/g.38754 Transcript_19003/m.38754 type:complete len:422 (+) Transcript_19003:1823-3088(+)
MTAEVGQHHDKPADDISCQRHVRNEARVQEHAHQHPAPAHHLGPAGLVFRGREGLGREAGDRKPHHHAVQHSKVCLHPIHPLLFELPPPREDGAHLLERLLPPRPHEHHCLERAGSSELAGELEKLGLGLPPELGVLLPVCELILTVLLLPARRLVAQLLHQRVQHHAVDRLGHGGGGGVGGEGVEVGSPEGGGERGDVEGVVVGEGGHELEKAVAYSLVADDTVVVVGAELGEGHAKLFVEVVVGLLQQARAARLEQRAHEPAHGSRGSVLAAFGSDGEEDSDRHLTELGTVDHGNQGLQDAALADDRKRGERSVGLKHPHRSSDEQPSTLLLLSARRVELDEVVLKNLEGEGVERWDLIVERDEELVASAIAHSVVEQPFHNPAQDKQRELAVCLAALREARELCKEVGPLVRPFAFCD